jgi:hypothetical protein
MAIFLTDLLYPLQVPYVTTMLTFIAHVITEKTVFYYNDLILMPFITWNVHNILFKFYTQSTASTTMEFIAHVIS